MYPLPEPAGEAVSGIVEDTAVEIGHPRCRVLWDGDCEICRHVADWVERHDRSGSFEVVPYQKVMPPLMTVEFAERCRHSVQVVPAHGDVIEGARAIAFILRQLGWPRLAALLEWGPAGLVSERIYRLIARNRRLLAFLLLRRPLADPPVERPAIAQSDAGGEGCGRLRAPASAPHRTAGSNG